MMKLRQLTSALLAAVTLMGAMAIPSQAANAAGRSHYTDLCITQDKTAFTSGSFGSAESTGRIGGKMSPNDYEFPGLAPDYLPYYEYVDDSIRWELRDGVLVFTGTGGFPDCIVGRGPFDGNPHIETVIVGPGINYLNGRILQDLPNLKTLIVLDGHTTVDAAAQNCPSLSTVILGADLQNKDLFSAAIVPYDEKQPSVYMFSPSLNDSPSDGTYVLDNVSIAQDDAANPFFIKDGKVPVFHYDDPTAENRQAMFAWEKLDKLNLLSMQEMKSAVKPVIDALPQFAKALLPTELTAGSSHTPDPVKPVNPTEPDQPAEVPSDPTEDFVNSETHLRTSYHPSNYVDLAIQGDTLTVSGRLLMDGLTQITVTCGSSTARTPAASGAFFSVQLPLRHPGASVFKLGVSKNFSSHYTYYMYRSIFLEQTPSGYRIMPSKIQTHNDAIAQKRWIPQFCLSRTVPASVAAMSDQIVGSETDDYTKVFLLHKWVAENIAYDYDAYRDPSLRTMDSAVVLQNRRGVCAGYSSLLRDLILAQGIPAAYAGNSALNSSSYALTQHPGEPHAHTEAYVDGRWIVMDSTWDSNNEYHSGSYQMKPLSGLYYFDITSEAFAMDHMNREHEAFLRIGDFQLDPITGHLQHYYGPGGHVVVPDHITAIPDHCFSFSQDLTEITLPEGLTSIGSGAFLSCDYLRQIKIPESVTFIGERAFFGCNGLTDIAFGGTKAQWAAISTSFSDELPGPVTIHCADGDVTVDPHPVKPEPVKPEPIKPEPVKPEPIKPDRLTQKVHSWAQSAVVESIHAGLVPTHQLGSDYTLSITRSQFAALAVNTYEAATGKTGVCTSARFADGVSEDMAILYRLGVISGYNQADRQADVTVGIHDLITREQAAVILAKLAEVIGHPLTPAVSLPFTDAISAWALDSVRKVYHAGIMQGYGTGAFGSQDSYTIEQSIVTMLHIFEMPGIETPKPQDEYYLDPEDYWSGNYDIVVDENGYPHAVSRPKK